MAATATCRTIAATCRRCGDAADVDRRQQLCWRCRWDLGLTGMERSRVQVQPIAHPPVLIFASDATDR